MQTLRYPIFLLLMAEFLVSGAFGQGNLPGKKACVRVLVADPSAGVPLEVKLGDFIQVHTSADTVVPDEQEKIFSVSPTRESYKKTYNISINLRSPRYLRINIRAPLGSINLPEFMVFPADSVMITITGSTVKFSGKNRGRYRCLYEVDRIKEAGHLRDSPEDVRALRDYFRQVDSCALEAFQKVRSFRRDLSEEEYLLIRNKIIADFQEVKNTYLYMRSDQLKLLHGLLEGYRNPIWNKQIAGEVFSRAGRIRSKQFLSFVISQDKIDSGLLAGRPYDLKKAYQFFVNRFKGSTREWIIYHLLEPNINSPYDISYLVLNSLEQDYLKTPRIKRFVKELKEFKLPGTIAFNFCLKDVNGNNVRLTDFRNKLVLLDFYSLGCSPCIALHPILDSIRNLFSTSEFALVTVYIEYGKGNKELFLKQVSSGRYTSPENVNLRAVASEPGNGLEVMKRFYVRGTPTLVLIDGNGRLTRNAPRPTPVDPRGQELVQLINDSFQSERSVFGK